jgi:predicted phosphodiesterase
MLYALLGDIHANLQAFEAALKKTYEEGADVRLGVGDLVGYCADPNGCINLARKEGVNNVLGNHDAAILPDGSPKKVPARMNPPAKDALEYTDRVITEENRNYLNGLPILNDGGRMIVVHSTMVNPEDFPK